MNKKPPLNDYDRKALEWYAANADGLGEQIAGLCQRVIVTEDAHQLGVVALSSRT